MFCCCLISFRPKRHLSKPQGLRSIFSQLSLLIKFCNRQLFYVSNNLIRSEAIRGAQKRFRFQVGPQNYKCFAFLDKFEKNCRSRYVTVVSNNLESCSTHYALTLKVRKNNFLRVQNPNQIKFEKKKCFCIAFLYFIKWH